MPPVLAFWPNFRASRRAINTAPPFLAALYCFCHVRNCEAAALLSNKRHIYGRTGDLGAVMELSALRASSSMCHIMWNIVGKPNCARWNYRLCQSRETAAGRGEMCVSSTKSTALVCGPKFSPGPRERGDPSGSPGLRPASGGRFFTRVGGLGPPAVRCADHPTHPPSRPAKSLAGRPPTHPRTAHNLADRSETSDHPPHPPGGGQSCPPGLPLASDRPLGMPLGGAPGSR